MRSDRVAIIGAGIGGLVTAVELASAGFDVTVLERAAGPGGKMRELEIDGARIDAGPTVFTMRRVFDEIFAAAGARLDDHLTLHPVATLARHAWSATERLDLHADVARSADAIGDFAGAADARRYRAFADTARRIYQTLESPYLRRPAGGPLDLVRAVGLRGVGDLWRIRPFATLWRALGDHFADPRLRQLFGRYATYCGSSPYLAPATLMLVAHVERDGVWLVDGGTQRIADALAALAARLGARFRYGAEAAEVLVESGRAAGVRLVSGERVPAGMVVANADVAAVASGRLGRAAARATKPVPRKDRSLSALTWSMVAETRGFPLLRHTVFFSGDYAAEFADIFGRSQLPSSPTVYVCAQDRGDRDDPSPRGAERVFCLVNAPATGDVAAFTATEVRRCEERTFERLRSCGLEVTRRPERMRVTTPRQFEHLFPGTGGALYGRASHGWTASFARPGSRSRIPGLYFAGGSTHPGPGVPMAAISGRLAAAALIADRASMRRSPRVAMHGGMSTR